MEANIEYKNSLASRSAVTLIMYLDLLGQARTLFAFQRM